jgi:hypothetical protein
MWLNILRLVVTQRLGFLVTNEISLLRYRRWRPINIILTYHGA